VFGQIQIQAFDFQARSRHRDRIGNIRNVFARIKTPIEFLKRFLLSLWFSYSRISFFLERRAEMRRTVSPRIVVVDSLLILPSNRIELLDNLWIDRFFHRLFWGVD
jgi:hypothetical protein